MAVFIVCLEVYLNLLLLSLRLHSGLIKGSFVRGAGGWVSWWLDAEDAVGGLDVLC